jgi:hypothetical protein
MKQQSKTTKAQSPICECCGEEFDPRDRAAIEQLQAWLAEHSGHGAQARFEGRNNRQCRVKCNCGAVICGEDGSTDFFKGRVYMWLCDLLAAQLPSPRGADSRHN